MGGDIDGLDDSSGSKVPRNKYLSALKPKDEDPLYLLDMIGKIRRLNNENWMDLLRIAFQAAPEEAKKIMSRIVECDTEITKLTKKLSEV